MDRGERLPDILDGSSTRQLVAALAAAAAGDDVSANAIATEILNRERRAPYLGAFLVSSTTLVLIYVLDYIYTRTLLILDTSPRAVILALFTGAIAGASLVTFLMWRGRLSWLHYAIHRRRAY